MIAAKQPIITYPTRTNQIPRHVPPPHWASHPYVLFAAAGLLPFGTIFVELYFAMTSIWQVCFFFSVQPVMAVVGAGHYFHVSLLHYAGSYDKFCLCFAVIVLCYAVPWHDDTCFPFGS